MIERNHPVSSTVLNYNNDVVAPQPCETCSDLMQNSTNQSSIIAINIGGTRFQTYLHTLERFPETLLGHEIKRKKYWNEEQKEYFFDRNRACFESILSYYQSNGQLHRPTDVPLETFIDEICFFQLGPTAYEQVKTSESLRKPKIKRISKPEWRKVLWCHLAYPDYSRLALAIHIISLFLTVTSCIVLALSTLPGIESRWINNCVPETNNSVNSTAVPSCPAIFESPLFIIQTICTAYFTIEFFFRLISTPSYKRFALNVFTWIDLSAIIPYFIDLGLAKDAIFWNGNLNSSVTSSVLRVLRLLRVLKLFTIFTQWRSLRALGIALKRCLIDFLGIMCGLFICAFLFGSIAYCAESGTNGEVFDSIPRATYWGLITITTVGYGDMYPTTTIGRIVACLCALCGTTIIGMLVSVLVDNYQQAFKKMQTTHERETCFIRIENVANQWETKKVDESIEPRPRRYSQIKEKPTRQRISSLNHQKPLQSNGRSEINFSVLLNDGTFDDQQTGQILEGFREKFVELQKTMKRDLHFSIEDVDSKDLTKSDSPPLVITAPSFSKNIVVIDGTIDLSSDSYVF